LTKKLIIKVAKDVLKMIHAGNIIFLYGNAVGFNVVG
jgi:hypothetical protein